LACWHWLGVVAQRWIELIARDEVYVFRAIQMGLAKTRWTSSG
jgi:hypothetical protein